jgi:hypothetical protein
MSKELIEQLANDDSKVSWRIVTTHKHELDMLDNGSMRLKFDGKVIIVESMAVMLDAFAKAYQAAAPIDVPPDEYDIAVDTGDGIYHTAEVVHFQQEGSKRSIQVKLTYAEPTKEHPTIMAYPSGQIVMESGELFVGKKYICIDEAYQAAAPIDNVAEALQEIFDLCMKYQRSCYNTGYLHLADALLNIASKANTLIRVIPDTQAKAQPIQASSKKIVGYITPSDLEFPFAYPNLGYEADWRNIPVYVDVPAAPIESERE